MPNKMKNPDAGMQLYKGFSISRDGLIKINKYGDTSIAMQFRSDVHPTSNLCLVLLMLFQLPK